MSGQYQLFCECRKNGAHCGRQIAFSSTEEAMPYFDSENAVIVHKECEVKPPSGLIIVGEGGTYIIYGRPIGT